METDVVNIRLMSDLHLEHIYWGKRRVRKLVHQWKKHPKWPASTDNEILVLAGDIGYAPATPDDQEPLEEFLRLMRETWPIIIFVPGNHEYYCAKERNQSIDDVDALLRTVCDRVGVHFLQRDALYLEHYDLSIYGCTFWSDIDEKEYLELNDSDYIFSEYSQYRAQHQIDAAWVSTVKGKGLIVTHHPPGPIRDQLWCHGHTHQYRRTETIYSNPVGYWNAPCSYKWETVALASKIDGLITI